jgi:recombinational DNA repair protein RecR
MPTFQPLMPPCLIFPARCSDSNRVEPLVICAVVMNAEKEIIERVSKFFDKLFCLVNQICTTKN